MHRVCARRSKYETICQPPPYATFMKRNLTLVITSMVSILLLTFHLTSDTLRARAGNPEAGGSTLVAVPVLVLLLYGTLVLAERRSGYVIMLIGAIIAMGMPIIHVTGPAGVFKGVLAKGNGDFIFVWTLHALGVTGMFQFILAARALFRPRREEPQPERSEGGMNS